MDRESLWLPDSHIACLEELPGNMSIVNRVSSKMITIKSAIIAPRNHSFSNVFNSGLLPMPREKSSDIRTTWLPIGCGAHSIETCVNPKELMAGTCHTSEAMGLLEGSSIFTIPQNVNGEH